MSQMNISHDRAPKPQTTGLPGRIASRANDPRADIDVPASSSANTTTTARLSPATALPSVVSRSGGETDVRAVTTGIDIGRSTFASAGVAIAGIPVAAIPIYRPRAISRASFDVMTAGSGPADRATPSKPATARETAVTGDASAATGNVDSGGGIDAGAGITAGASAVATWNQALTPEQVRLERKAITDINILCTSYNARNVHDFRQAPDSGNLLTAARKLYLARSVVLSTGFNVQENMPETDGPPGVAALGHALAQLGKRVAFVCDETNLHLVKQALLALDPENELGCRFFAMDEKDEAAVNRANALLDRLACDAHVALELTGRNLEGQRLTMRGEGINYCNGAVDEITNQANRRGICTIGVGDGGNESGMGDALNIPAALNGKTMQAAVGAQHQVFSWNSNLGGIALAEIVLAWGGKRASALSEDQLHDLVAKVVAGGASDGVTRQRTQSVDGFPVSDHAADLRKLRAISLNIPARPHCLPCAT
jgi:hypothetical protein